MILNYIYTSVLDHMCMFYVSDIIFYFFSFVPKLASTTTPLLKGEIVAPNHYRPLEGKTEGTCLISNYSR
jgi:hypothetical protein